MFFRRSAKWDTSVKQLQGGAISVQEFVNAHEKKVLYHTTPFFENGSGNHPNVLHTSDSDVMYFPAFTSISALREHMTAIGCAEHIIIRGDLKSVLASLDAHPLLQEWGVVIDPQSAHPADIPPGIRVQPKCLR